MILQGLCLLSFFVSIHVPMSLLDFDGDLDFFHFRSIGGGAAKDYFYHGCICTLLGLFLNNNLAV